MLVFFNTEQNLGLIRNQTSLDVSHTKALLAKRLDILQLHQSILYRTHNQIYEKTQQYDNWKYVLQSPSSEELLDQILEFRLSQNDIWVKIIDDDLGFLKSFEKQFFIYNELVVALNAIDNIATHVETLLDIAQGDQRSFNPVILQSWTELNTRRNEDLNNILKFHIDHYSVLLELNLNSTDCLEGNINILNTLPKVVIQNIRKLFT